METNPTHEVAIQGALSGTFTAPTGEDTYGAWTDLSTSSSITPQSITPANSEYAASYQALLIPQTIGDAFISITIDDKTYRYTPETGTTLQPGHVYTYNITVFSYGLEVQVTESIDWNTGNPGSGNITLKDSYDPATNTYSAYTAAGLKEWAQTVRDGNLNAKCLLFDDIDFNGGEWTPVGTYGNDTGFSGIFDGQGHTISNMQITNNEDGYAGLFAYIEEGGRVQNVEFKSTMVDNGSVDEDGAVAFYGARIKEADQEKLSRLGLDRGVEIVSVGPGKIMDAGVSEGFVILYVNVTRTFPANYVFQYNRTHQIPIENFR